MSKKKLKTLIQLIIIIAMIFALSLVKKLIFHEDIFSAQGILFMLMGVISSFAFRNVKWKR